MTACDALDGSHHQHRGAKVRCHSMGSECLLSANRRSSEGCVRASAFPREADIKNWMSAFLRKMSVQPSTADVIEGLDFRPFVTQSGSRMFR